MAKLLLNLRYVPEDEAADVRAFLDAAGMEWYQTRPSPFGISQGGIWLRNNEDLPEAKRLMADYQRERQARARNQPRNRILREHSLWPLARFQPDNTVALARIEDMHPKTVRQDGETLLQLIREAAALPPEQWPDALPEPFRQAAGEVVFRIDDFAGSAELITATGGIVPGVTYVDDRAALPAMAIVAIAAVLVALKVANRSGGDGVVVVHQYVQALYLLPYAVLVVPLVTSVFPHLSELRLVGDVTGFARVAAVSVRTVIGVSVVGAAMLIAAGPALGPDADHEQCGHGHHDGGDDEVPGHPPRVELGEHHDAADDRLRGDAGQQAHGEPERAPVGAAQAPQGQEHGRGDDHQHEGERAVAELDVAVDAHLGRVGERLRGALRPGGAAQAGAGQADGAAGHDDADLGGQGCHRQGEGAPRDAVG